MLQYLWLKCLRFFVSVSNKYCTYNAVLNTWYIYPSSLGMCPSSLARQELRLELFFTVPYFIFLNQKTKVVTVDVPAYGGQVDGSCSDNDTQWMEISWGIEGTSMVRLTFEKSSDNSTWALSDFTASLYMDSKTFVNASKEGGLMHTLTFCSYLFGFQAVYFKGCNF